MATFKHVPELVRVRGKWTVEPFAPMQAAFDWDKMRGLTGTLYVMKSDDFCKIGITTNLKKRLAGIDSGMPTPVKLVASRTVPRAGLTYAEAWLHKKFAMYRVKGEWFRMDASLATKSLQMAIVRAHAYARCCAEWFAAEEAGKHINDDFAEETIQVPKVRERVFVGWPTKQDFDEMYSDPKIIAALDSLAS